MEDEKQREAQYVADELMLLGRAVPGMLRRLIIFLVVARHSLRSAEENTAKTGSDSIRS